MNILIQARINKQDIPSPKDTQEKACQLRGKLDMQQEDISFRRSAVYRVT